MTHEPNCTCDRFVHPAPLAIDAGLSSLPRQVASFAEFRHAMLSALPARAPLASWRARSDQDLGVMLIEMWAYVCDAVTFYDGLTANESYLRTAHLAPSVRKLVGLLGYRPRPAVAARAVLALKADGRQPVMLPAGLAFRSSAVGASPPQVFELDAATRVHPLLNGWPLEVPRPAEIPGGPSSLLLAARTARVRPDDTLLLLAGSDPAEVFGATAVETVTGSDGTQYRKVSLSRGLPRAVPLASARLLRPTAAAALWSSPTDTSYPLAAGVTWLYLSGIVPQIRSGGRFVARGPSERAAFTITSIVQAMRLLVPATTVGDNKVPIPAVSVPVTQVWFSPPWPATMSVNPGQITIEYDLQDAGTVTTELPARIQAGSQLRLRAPVEAPPDGTQPSRFLVIDADGTGLDLLGGVDFATRTLSIAPGSTMTGPLDPPATALANVALVSRGETVPAELIGVGDGSIANQSFKLKKKPLTYLTSPTSADPNGLTSTLRVRVRDIEWTEVASYFGVPPNATVYIVRHDDAAESSVVFGDGIRGARLPSGAPVVASYRFGAGAASPAAGGITQLARPVKGITSVTSALAAAGGAEAQPPAQVRTYAPRSALLFGRAVSIQDMEALAAGQAGVRAVHAEWMWDESMQLPAVHLWYIGPDGIAATVAASLRSATAPSTPINAGPATAVPADLDVEVTVDRRFQPSLVTAAVIARLTADGSGLLSPERIGIGQPLYRSRILAEVLAVGGVASVHALAWQGQPLESFAIAPGPGSWFQVALTISVTEAQDA